MFFAEGSGVRFHVAACKRDVFTNQYSIFRILQISLETLEDPQMASAASALRNVDRRVFFKLQDR